MNRNDRIFDGKHYHWNGETWVYVGKVLATGEAHKWQTNKEYVVQYIQKWKDPVLEIKKLLGNPALNTFATINVLGDFYNWLHDQKIEGGKFTDIYTNPKIKEYVIKEYLKQYETVAD